MPVIKLKFPFKPLPIPKDACKIWGRTYCLDDGWDGAIFSLTRTRESVTIHIFLGGYSWTLPNDVKTFAEARKFVKNYAKRHGQVIKEHRPERRPRKPKGQPCEAWLSSENPAAFAEAMIKCQHSGAFCAQDGFCHFDGECFCND